MQRCWCFGDCRELQRLHRIMSIIINVFGADEENAMTVIKMGFFSKFFLECYLYTSIYGYLEYMFKQNDFSLVIGFDSHDFGKSSSLNLMHEVKTSSASFEYSYSTVFKHHTSKTSTPL